MDSENITPIQFLSMYQNNPKKETANERKATEIAKNIVGNDHYSYFYEFKQCALQAMQWKDEQFAKEKQEWIEKACDTIKHLLDGYVIRNFNFGDSYDMDELIDDFKNAMKGE